MGILSKLFATSEVATKLADGVYKGIDASFYTPEEQIDNRLKAIELYVPFKIAQRFLALIFGIPYALAWFITFIVTFLGQDITPQLELLSGTMGQIVLAIIAFYFLGGTLNNLVKKG